MKRPSQRDEVLQYLLHNPGLTSQTGFSKLSATRLSGIILVLRNRGYKIDSFECHGIHSHTGRPCRYDFYSLLDPRPQATPYAWKKHDITELHKYRDDTLFEKFLSPQVP